MRRSAGAQPWLIVDTIIRGHFQPSRQKMSHFSAEIVPRPDKISAENVRKILSFFYTRFHNPRLPCCLVLGHSGNITYATRLQGSGTLRRRQHRWTINKTTRLSIYTSVSWHMQYLPALPPEDDKSENSMVLQASNSSFSPSSGQCTSVSCFCPVCISP